MSRIFPTLLPLVLLTACAAPSASKRPDPQFVSTGRIMDIAIQGSGYLVLRGDDAIPLYTRDGQLRVDTDGNLVATDAGYPLYPPLVVPAGTVSIDILSDGTVTANVAAGHSAPGSETHRTIGVIPLATFAHPDKLQRTGGNIFKETPESGPPTLHRPTQGGAGRLLQGFLEQSNIKK